jgi:hypothetical protein
MGCNFDDANMDGVKFIDNTNDLAGSPLLDQGGVIRRFLPDIRINGPFGSGANEAFKYEVAILIGSGRAVITFALILKSAWYKINYPRERRLFKKLYFFWMCKDFAHLPWLQYLCMAVEEDDLDHKIEIHTVSPTKAARVPMLIEHST